mgnify:CR=1 FL=1
MELLKERILKDGTVKPGNVLKVDSFLNHQMDIPLINEIGKEFKRIYADAPITKILTIEHPVLELHVLRHNILMYLLFLPKKQKV